MNDNWNAGAGFIQGRKDPKIENLEKRIAELEAIVVQQRDGFFEQNNRIADLEAENERLRAERALKRIAELEAENARLHETLTIGANQNADLNQKNANLESENEQLREALDKCADDLKGYVEHQYAFMHDDPDMKRRYERDIEPVRKARKLLAAMEEE